MKTKLLLSTALALLMTSSVSVLADSFDDIAAHVQAAEVNIPTGSLSSATQADVNTVNTDIDQLRGARVQASVAQININAAQAQMDGANKEYQTVYQPQADKVAQAKDLLDGLQKMYGAAGNGNVGLAAASAALTAATTDLNVKKQTLYDLINPPKGKSPGTPAQLAAANAAIVTAEQLAIRAADVVQDPKNGLVKVQQAQSDYNDALAKLQTINTSINQDKQAASTNLQAAQNQLSLATTTITQTQNSLIVLGLKTANEVSADVTTFQDKAKQAAATPAPAAPALAGAGSSTPALGGPALLNPGVAGGGLLSEGGNGAIGQNAANLISPNGGTIVSEGGNGIVTDQGAGAIAKNAPVISNDGGSAVAKSGAGLVGEYGGGFIPTVRAFSGSTSSTAATPTPQQLLQTQQADAAQLTQQIADLNTALTAHSPQQTQQDYQAQATAVAQAKDVLDGLQKIYGATLSPGAPGTPLQIAETALNQAMNVLNTAKADRDQVAAFLNDNLKNVPDSDPTKIIMVAALAQKNADVQTAEQIAIRAADVVQDPKNGLAKAQQTVQQAQDNYNAALAQLQTLNDQKNTAIANQQQLASLQSALDADNSRIAALSKIPPPEAAPAGPDPAQVQKALNTILTLDPKYFIASFEAFNADLLFAAGNFNIPFDQQTPQQQLVTNIANLTGDTAKTTVKAILSQLSQHLGLYTDQMAALLALMPQITANMSDSTIAALESGSLAQAQDPTVMYGFGGAAAYPRTVLLSATDQQQYNTGYPALRTSAYSASSSVTPASVQDNLTQVVATAVVQNAIQSQAYADAQSAEIARKFAAGRALTKAEIAKLKGTVSQICSGMPMSPADKTALNKMAQVQVAAVATNPAASTFKITPPVPITDPKQVANNLAQYQFQIVLAQRDLANLANNPMFPTAAAKAQQKAGLEASIWSANYFTDQINQQVMAAGPKGAKQVEVELKSSLKGQVDQNYIAGIKAASKDIVTIGSTGKVVMHATTVTASATTVDPTKDGSKSQSKTSTGNTGNAGSAGSAGGSAHEHHKAKSPKETNTANNSATHTPHADHAKHDNAPKLHVTASAPKMNQAPKMPTMPKAPPPPPSAGHKP